MAISASDARALFTKMLIDVYQERLRPSNFLRNLFPAVTTPTKEISIEVERMAGEFTAVDVVRGTEGNRNTFSLSSEKIFVPPLYREYFDATQLDLYDRVLGSQGNAQTPLFTALMNSVADKLSRLQDKIERSYELQCAQVLMTGIVSLKQQTSIDFKRKAASLVDDGAGQYFASAIDPFTKFEAGCKFLREVGKSGDAIFNAVLGSTAMADLLKNTAFLARQNQYNLSLDAVQGPTRDVNAGASFWGTVVAGSYKVQLWTYPQIYNDQANSNAATPYIDPKKVVMFPMAPRFKFAFGAIPKLIGSPGDMPTQGAYVVGEFTDERKTTHDFDIQSAGVAIPVAVDQIYTFKAVA